MSNTQRLPRNISRIIAIICLLALGLSFFESIHPAIFFLTIFFGITAFAVSMLFNSRYKCLESMINGASCIAHWLYDDAYLNQRIEWERKEMQGNKTVAFYGLSFLIIFVMVIVAISARGDFNVGFLLAFFVILIDVFAYLIIISTRDKKNDVNKDVRLKDKRYQRRRYVYVSNNGIYAHGIMHMWKGWGSKLTSVLYEKDSCTFYFTYRYFSGYIISSYTVDLQVPDCDHQVIADICHAFDVKKQ